MWCSELSLVTQRSKNGQITAPPRMIPRGRAKGMSTDSVSVCPRKLTSHEGMIRSAPSRIPRYQSGCEADEIANGEYGPYSQTGLICANVASSVSAAKMKRNQAVPLRTKYG